MTSTRARRSATALLLANFVGALGVVAGAWLRSDAERSTISASSHSTSRVLELHEVATLLRAGGPAAGEALSRLRATAAAAEDDAELRSLEKTIACVESPSCATVAEDLRAVGDVYSAALARKWKEAAREASHGAELLTIGVAVMTAGSFVSLVLIALSRRDEEPDRVGAEAERLRWARELESRRAVEAMLRTRLEELYRVRRRAWEADRFAAYGELAAGLSHGLKTPLAGIRAAAQAAQLKLESAHPAMRHLDDVIVEVDSLVEEVRRFLQATGTGAPIPCRVGLASLAETLVADYSGAAESRQLRVELSDDSAGAEVLVDPALLEMALRNLLENALGAAPAGSAVRLRAALTDAPSRAGLESERPSGGEAWIELAIRNEGPPIPPHIANGAMDGSFKPGGSGLGVAIARRIVGRHGGALVFDPPSTAGGTTAHVVLPLTPERA